MPKPSQRNAPPSGTSRRWCGRARRWSMATAIGCPCTSMEPHLPFSMCAIGRPWTTIKYRVSGSSLANVNQSAASAQNATVVNSLNQIYPNSQRDLYPVPSTTEQADTPQPVRFANVDQILAAARTSSQIPNAIQDITALLRERHHIRPGESDDFSIRDM